MSTRCPTVAAAVPWTQERLPDGVGIIRDGPTCRTCNATHLDSDMLRRWTQITRTVEPGADGQYAIQAHTEWCPVWTGVKPELPCPRCGAPVETVNHRPGYSLAIPDPAAPRGVGHLVGPADEVLNHPRAVFAEERPKREPSLDKVTVGPCGHDVEGDDAHKVVLAAARIRTTRHQAQTDEVLDGARALLDAAVEAGHGDLAEAYRQAVQGRTGDARGLLAALRILHPRQP